MWIDQLLLVPSARQVGSYVRKNQKQFGVWMDTHHATIIGHNPDATASLS